MHPKKKNNYIRLKSIKGLFNQKKYSRALTEIEDYMNDYPRDDFAKYLYGKILTLIGENEKAKNTFEAIIKSEKNNKYSAQIELARLCMENDSNYAKKLLYDAIKNSDFDETEAKKLLATIEIQEEKYSKALKLLNELNDELEVIELKIKAYANLNDKSKVNELYNKINIKKCPRKNLLSIMESLFMVGEYDKSLDLGKNLSTKKDECYKLSLLTTAKIFNKLGLHNEALNNLEIISTSDDEIKDNPKVLLELGSTYHKLSNYNKAYELYNKVIDLKVNNISSMAYFKLGYLEQEAHHFEDAKKIYNDLISNSYKKRSEAYINLISINLKEKNYDECYKLLAKMIEKTKDYTPYDLKLIKLLLDKSSGKKVRYERSLSYTEQQIISYSEEKCRKHIIEHRKANAQFNELIDYDELIDFTKKQMKSSNLAYGDLFDIYEIDLEDCGANTNKYRVIVIPNTKNIVTMYPHIENKYNRVDDFENTRLKEEEVKEKRRQKIIKRFNYKI